MVDREGLKKLPLLYMEDNWPPVVVAKALMVAAC
jgi:hypothetical protein